MCVSYTRNGLWDMVFRRVISSLELGRPRHGGRSIGRIGFHRGLGVDVLEARHLLSATLLHTLNDASEYSFGQPVAISGNTLVVGQWRDAGLQNDVSTAHIYDATSGTLLHTLTNPTPAFDDSFGFSLAISDNTVVVGAPYDDAGAEDAGVAYVYDATSGILLHTLHNPNPAPDSGFGARVAVSGNTIVVGAPGDNTGANIAGRAYVYDATSGALLHTLNNPSPATEDWFGESVAISGNTIVVGAYEDDTGALNAGSAYLFDATSGALLHHLTNPTPEVDDIFGLGVAISGNTVLVAAPGDDTGTVNAGSVYAFDATSGTLLHSLHNPTPELNDFFGYLSVAISGNTIAVGALRDDTGGLDSGSAYLFDAASGSLRETVTNPTPAPGDPGDEFGWVAVSGNMLVVGAPYDDTAGMDAGSAYVFRLVDADFNDDGSYDCLDIDLLVAEIAAGTNGHGFDVTGDGLVDLADRDAWLAEAGELNLGPGKAYLLGDANLDGFVDVLDFNVWTANKFTSVAEWCAGDFNVDGIVDGLDFMIWNTNKFQSMDGASEIVLSDRSSDAHEIAIRNQVYSGTDMDASSVIASVAPLALERIDSVFALSRRGEDHNVERPKTDLFENFGDELTTPRPVRE